MPPTPTPTSGHPSHPPTHVVVTSHTISINTSLPWVAITGIAASPELGTWGHPSVTGTVAPDAAQATTSDQLQDAQLAFLQTQLPNAGFADSLMGQSFASLSVSTAPSVRRTSRRPGTPLGISPPSLSLPFTTPSRLTVPNIGSVPIAPHEIPSPTMSRSRRVTRAQPSMVRSQPSALAQGRPTAPEMAPPSVLTTAVPSTSTKPLPVSSTQTVPSPPVTAGASNSTNAEPSSTAEASPPVAGEVVPSTLISEVHRRQSKHLPSVPTCHPPSTSTTQALATAAKPLPTIQTKAVSSTTTEVLPSTPTKSLASAAARPMPSTATEAVQSMPTKAPPSTLTKAPPSSPIKAPPSTPSQSVPSAPVKAAASPPTKAAANTSTEVVSTPTKVVASAPANILAATPTKAVASAPTNVVLSTSASAIPPIPAKAVTSTATEHASSKPTTVAPSMSTQDTPAPLKRTQTAPAKPLTPSHAVATKGQPSPNQSGEARMTPTTTKPKPPVNRVLGTTPSVTLSPDNVLRDAEHGRSTPLESNQPKPLPSVSAADSLQGLTTPAESLSSARTTPSKTVPLGEERPSSSPTQATGGTTSPAAMPLSASALLKAPPAAAPSKTALGSTPPGTSPVATPLKTPSVATLPETPPTATPAKTHPAVTSPKATLVATNPLTPRSATLLRSAPVPLSPRTLQSTASLKATSVTTPPRTPPAATYPRTHPSVASPRSPFSALPSRRATLPLPLPSPLRSTATPAAVTTPPPQLRDGTSNHSPASRSPRTPRSIPASKLTDRTAQVSPTSPTNRNRKRPSETLFLSPRKRAAIGPGLRELGFSPNAPRVVMRQRSDSRPAARRPEGWRAEDPNRVMSRLFGVDVNDPAKLRQTTMKKFVKPKRDEEHPSANSDLQKRPRKDSDDNDDGTTSGNAGHSHTKQGSAGKAASQRSSDAQPSATTEPGSPGKQSSPGAQPSSVEKPSSPGKPSPSVKNSAPAKTISPSRPKLVSSASQQVSQLHSDAARPTFSKPLRQTTMLHQLQKLKEAKARAKTQCNQAVIPNVRNSADTARHAQNDHTTTCHIQNEQTVMQQTLYNQQRKTMTNHAHHKHHHNHDHQLSNRDEQSTLEHARTTNANASIDSAVRNSLNDRNRHSTEERLNARNRHSIDKLMTYRVRPRFDYRLNDTTRSKDKRLSSRNRYTIGKSLSLPHVFEAAKLENVNHTMNETIDMTEDNTMNETIDMTEDNTMNDTRNTLMHIESKASADMTKRNLSTEGSTVIDDTSIKNKVSNRTEHDNSKPVYELDSTNELAQTRLENLNQLSSSPLLRPKPSDETRTQSGRPGRTCSPDGASHSPVGGLRVRGTGLRSVRQAPFTVPGGPSNRRLGPPTRSAGPSTAGAGRSSRQGPSSCCHVCHAKAGSSSHMPCSGLIRKCRKVICWSCLLLYDQAQAAEPQEGWNCLHCRESCPSIAQCFRYKEEYRRRKMGEGKKEDKMEF